jgi:hypothetical protein
VSLSPLQFAKRQMQGTLTSPILWVALAAAAAVFGMVGPFGTYEALSLPARLGYWALVAVTTYLIGFLCVTLLEAHLRSNETRPSTAAFAVYGAVAGLPVTLVVYLINMWVFDTTVIGFGLLLAYTVPLSAIASGCVAYFSIALHSAPSLEPSTAPQRPPLLDRLPPERRGELYYLTMQDHYVEVVTSNGISLVLLRLADAIKETTPVEGVQIHRSHWIARNAVRETERRGDSLVVKMANGTTLPVSRSRRKALRDAGLV